ncbi:GTP-binding protein [Bacillus sp. V3B]|uniref:CobW family GTP-binding protein n=1 Tax=Bacillus sp. V3B TaxID=2804915 RepID=UPI002109B518|nr:GTP-binding protein [Bacillus sp. V3B]MCQ6276612.1 GTP-binding protein [Bacillus sp. V3B]
MNKTEVYLLSGFLGSGKTTLLKNLLQEEKREGRKVAVLMNELGNVSIDSGAVGEDVPLKELLDGCICCTIQDKLEAQLQGLLVESKPEVIYIEATGVAHPVEVLDAVISPIFADRIQFKGIITIVDGKQFLERKSLSPQVQQLLLEQVKYANLLLVNKTDTCSADEQAKLSMEMGSVNPHAFAILTSFSKVPVREVRKMGFNENAISNYQHVHTDLHLRSFVYQFKHSINQTAFEDFLKNMPDTIYRIKGYVKFSEGTYPFLFQYSYGMPLYMKEYMNMPLNLVFIGEQIDWNQIDGQLSALEGG